MTFCELETRDVRVQFFWHTTQDPSCEPTLWMEHLGGGQNCVLPLHMLIPSDLDAY